ncbi:hypothetical protein UlMin_040800 [Ulmus minor]
MAGEIEEPFSLSFQADSLHSGSISFGRFEKEPLSWEKRSSFSHNRYLEEVEKCSKPGSVIEKKAYFEAHFKKKGLLRPDSFEYHSGTEYQGSENGVSDRSECREEFEHVNEGHHHSHYDGNPEGSEYHRQYDETGYEREDPRDSDYHGEYDSMECEREEQLRDSECHGEEREENPRGSEYHEEYEMMEDEKEYTQGLEYHDEYDVTESVADGGSEYHGDHEATECEEKDPRVSFPKMEPALTDDHVLVDGVAECENSERPHQTDSDHEKFSSINDEPRKEINQQHNEKAVNVDESSHPVHLFPKTQQGGKVDKTSSKQWPTSSQKLKPATKTKPSESKVISRTNLSRVQKNISGDASKDAVKKPIRREREVLGRTETAKQPTIPVCSTTKFEDSTDPKANLVHENKRGENESRGKKIVQSQPSLKDETRGHQMANRHNQSINSTKSDKRASAAAFNFRSHERAERRKEFFQKLEEKIHAKEAEMNKIQARTQEKTEAEIRQLRKSLNFKATPMPSFYHAAVMPVSDGNKAVSNKTKTSKSQSRSISAGSGTGSEMPSDSKAGYNQDPSANESVKATESSDASGETNRATAEPSEVSITSRSLTRKTSEAMRRTNVTKKEKEKDVNKLKHRASEINNKVSRGERINGKLKNESQSVNKTTRKSTKGVGIDNNASMGQLAVHVAS